MFSSSEMIFALFIVAPALTLVEYAVRRPCRFGGGFHPHLKCLKRAAVGSSAAIEACNLFSEYVLIFRLADHPTRINEALLPHAIGLFFRYVITEAIHARAVNRVRHA